MERILFPLRKLKPIRLLTRADPGSCYPRLSRLLIDEIDRVLAKHYGFTEEELDFIINYDIKYRMGESFWNEEESEASNEG